MKLFLDKNIRFILICIGLCPGQKHIINLVKWILKNKSSVFLHCQSTFIKITKEYHPQELLSVSSALIG